MPTDPPYDLADLKLDAQRAATMGLTFRVCTKERQGARWEVVGTGIPDLTEAVATAAGLGAYESGVITDGPEVRSGFIYWTSQFPDCLNTTVLTIEVR